MHYQYLTIIVTSSVFLFLAIIAAIVSNYLINKHSKLQLIKANKS